MNYVERRMAVFKAGEHTDSQGRARTWTKEDLGKIAGSYDPENHEAPVVIGHPQNNSPAYGWVKGLEMDDEGVLWAKTDILEEFDELVQKGAYKKRSISLYDDLSLRHVGFLGGQPPAVKGLPDLQFAAAEGVSIDFMAVTLDTKEPATTDHDRHDGSGKPNQRKEGMNMPLNIKELWNEFVASLTAKGVEITDEGVTFTEADVTAKVEAAKVEATKKAAAEFAEERKALQVEKDALATAARVQAREALVDYAESIQAKGHVTPAQAKAGMGLVSFMEALAHEDKPIEFTEGTEKKAQTTLEWFKSFAEGVVQVPMGRMVKADGPETGPAAGKLDKLIASKREANKELSYSQAFAEVQKENPDLAHEYASEITNQ